MSKLKKAIDEVVRYTFNPVVPEVIDYEETDFGGTGELPKFDNKSVHDSVKTAASYTNAWIKSIESKANPYWLTLFGVPGCGKTLLAKCARQQLREKGHTVQLWNWPKVWSMCLEGEWEILEHLISLPILILDDVGAEFTGTNKLSELNTARLYEIAEGRLEKWTFITSNLDLHQMDKSLGSRFVSRLFRGGSRLVDLTQAADYSYMQWQRTRNLPTTHNNENTSAQQS